MLAQWIVSLFALAISVLFFYESFFLKTFAAADPGGPALVPRVVCVITGAVALYHLIRLACRVPFRSAVQAIGQSLGATDGPLSDQSLYEGRRVSVVMILSVFYPWLMLKLGFVLGTMLFSAALSVMFRVKAHVVVTTALIVSFSIYYLFAHIMEVRIPPGQWVDIIHWF